ncbi:TVP38/TMEM64 family protein [Aliiglaciecola sp. LCG003]|uniref:TVP38/TMEM64 family protein n=1 Tax=Aliiglaciecola sp. LCG003 TaxID=3053655 RepID=UPI0025745494|nr:TVP38/TMEM64 family protein [Aliiglaciecola sp. LCG003]WJG09175.1 TVP38/TMEM64 family protein [Aliiglaciecola sp. LCG003]
MLKTSKFLMMLAASALFVLLLLGILFGMGFQYEVLELLRWVDSLGLWAPLIFIGIDLLLMIFLLPSILFTLGSGFLFGSINGGIYIIIATSLGSLCAFSISRYFFGLRIRNYLIKHEKYQFVNNELSAHGWKAILVLRLIPFFPLKLSNYFLGLTNFSAKHFLIGTILGIAPNTFLITYAGSLAADLTLLASGQLLRSPFMWALSILGFVLLLISVAYIMRLAQVAMNEIDPKHKLDNT